MQKQKYINQTLPAVVAFIWVVLLVLLTVIDPKPNEAQGLNRLLTMIVSMWILCRAWKAKKNSSVLDEALKTESKEYLDNFSPERIYFFAFVLVILIVSWEALTLGHPYVSESLKEDKNIAWIRTLVTIVPLYELIKTNWGKFDMLINKK